MSQLYELRAILEREEARRDVVNGELMELQQQLEQVMLKQEMLRERRGSTEPPPEPRVQKGVAVVDDDTYQSMLPEEQLEVNLFGFKLSYAVTSGASSKQARSPSPQALPPTRRRCCRPRLKVGPPGHTYGIDVGCASAQQHIRKTVAWTGWPIQGTVAWTG